MLDQTYDYAAMVAQFEADERLANRIDNQLNSPQRQSSLTITHTSSPRQPNRLNETLEEILEQSLNSSNNSNVTIRRTPRQSVTPKSEVFDQSLNFSKKTASEHAKINAPLTANGVNG